MSIYGRNGEELCALNLYEIEQIRSQLEEFDWTAQICPNATIYDLDKKALDIARENFKSKNRSRSFAGEIDGWDDLTFLN